jgi:hypothetical protein
MAAKENIESSGSISVAWRNEHRREENLAAASAAAWRKSIKSMAWRNRENNGGSVSMAKIIRKQRKMASKRRKIS